MDGHQRQCPAGRRLKIQRSHAPNITTDLSRVISSSMPALMASRTVIYNRSNTARTSQKPNTSIRTIISTQQLRNTASLTSTVAIVRLVMINAEGAGREARESARSVVANICATRVLCYAQRLTTSPRVQCFVVFWDYSSAAVEATRII